MRIIQTFFVIGTLIGMIYTLDILFRFLRFLYQHFIRKSKDLSLRYGKKSWVFITASSDGIGKGFAIAFAKRGFNIILSARNIDKLNKTANQLKQINREIQIKILVIDFKDDDNITFYDKIFDEIKHLDISILVNNIGLSSIRLFNLQQNEVKKYVNANIRCISIFTRKFIPFLLKRKNKSAIINLSSLMKYVPLATGNMYGATKKFDDFLSRSLSYEYPELDIISFSPSFVSTPANLNIDTDIFVISTEKSVESFLCDLGYQSGSSGAWSHKLQEFFTSRINDRISLFLSKFPPKKLKQVVDFYNKPI